MWAGVQRFELRLADPESMTDHPLTFFDVSDIWILQRLCSSLSLFVSRHFSVWLSNWLSESDRVLILLEATEPTDASYQ